MRLFRRRRGRHELGAAVRDIPSVPATWAAVTAAGVDQPVPPQSRVELGFRDGSTAALAPDSAPARALLALAGVLTRRD